MAKVYQYDALGYFVGEEEEAYLGFLPISTTAKAPPEQDGHIPRWDGEKWVLVENHKGKKGYVNGKRHTVTGYALPDDWSETPPPTGKERAEKQIARINARLADIDSARSRPLADLALGINVTFSTAKLQAIEEERASLAEEKMELQEQVQACRKKTS